MATNLETIKRAFRLLGVVDSEEELTASQSEDGLKALNEMLIRWEADNIPLGFTAQTSLSATLPVPDEALSPVAYNLAVEIAPEYQVAVPPQVASMAANYLMSVQRDAFIVTPSDPSGMPGVRGRWDINSDS